MSARELAGHFQAAGYVLVFTGAGLSTASGIPAFRGPQGLWQTWRPVYYHEFMSSHEARVAHWEFKLMGWDAFREARPNPAHHALVELEKLEKMQLLVTQNIDGLHQLAGQSADRIIELHGTNRLVECQSCRQLLDPEPVYEAFRRDRRPPLCSCNGFLKPATVSFGQTLPEEKLTKAFEAAKEADLVLAIGSTLEVEPAASVPRIAREHGAKYAIINRGPTAHDSIATLRVEGDCTLILPEAIAEVRGQS